VEDLGKVSEDMMDVAASDWRIRPATASMCCLRSKDGKDIVTRLATRVRRRRGKESGRKRRGSRRKGSGRHQDPLM
jgi:hypothetical protein